MIDAYKLKIQFSRAREMAQRLRTRGPGFNSLHPHGSSQPQFQESDTLTDTHLGKTPMYVK